MLPAETSAPAPQVPRDKIPCLWKFHLPPQALTLCIRST